MFRPERASLILRPITAAIGVRSAQFVKEPRGQEARRLGHQAPSLVRTSGPARPRSRAAPCVAFRAAMTRPMSLIDPRAGFGDGGCDRGIETGLVHLRRQETLDDGDLVLFLGRQLRAVALAKELDRLTAGFHHAAKHGHDLLVRHLVDAFGSGRDVDILELRQDHAQRRRAGRGAGPFIESFIWSVKEARRSISSPRVSRSSHRCGIDVPGDSRNDDDNVIDAPAHALSERSAMHVTAISCELVSHPRWH